MSSASVRSSPVGSSYTGVGFLTFHVKGILDHFCSECAIFLLCSSRKHSQCLANPLTGAMS